MKKNISIFWLVRFLFVVPQPLLHFKLWLVQMPNNSLVWRWLASLDDTTMSCPEQRFYVLATENDKGENGLRTIAAKICHLTEQKLNVVRS